MFQRSAPVQRSVDEHDGGANAARPMHRRAGPALGRRAENFVQVVQPGASCADVAVPVHGFEIVDAGQSYRAAVQLGLADCAHQRRIGAVAAAEDADSLGVGDFLRHGPAGGVGDVVLHPAAPFAEAGGQVREAVAGGAAEVHLQHVVAAAGEQLRLPVEPPEVAHLVRSAMHQNHHRAGALGVRVAGDVAVHGGAVADVQLHRLDWAQHLRLQLGTTAGNGLDALPLHVHQHEVAGLAIAADLRHRQVVVAGGAGELDGVLGIGLAQHGVLLRQRMVRLQIDGVRIVVIETHAPDAVAEVPLDGGEVHRRMAHEGLLVGVGLGVVQADAGGAAASAVADEILARCAGVPQRRPAGVSVAVALHQLPGFLALAKVHLGLVVHAFAGAEGDAAIVGRHERAPRRGAPGHAIARDAASGAPEAGVEVHLVHLSEAILGQIEEHMLRVVGHGVEHLAPAEPPGAPGLDGHHHDFAGASETGQHHAAEGGRHQQMVVRRPLQVGDLAVFVEVAVDDDVAALAVQHAERGAVLVAHGQCQVFAGGGDLHRAEVVRVRERGNRRRPGSVVRRGGVYVLGTERRPAGGAADAAAGGEPAPDSAHDASDRRKRAPGCRWWRACRRCR